MKMREKIAVLFEFRKFSFENVEINSRALIYIKIKDRERFMTKLKCQYYIHI